MVMTNAGFGWCQNAYASDRSYVAIAVYSNGYKVDGICGCAVGEAVAAVLSKYCLVHASPVGLGVRGSI